MTVLQVAVLGIGADGGGGSGGDVLLPSVRKSGSAAAHHASTGVPNRRQRTDAADTISVSWIPCLAMRGAVSGSVELLPPPPLPAGGNSPATRTPVTASGTRHRRSLSQSRNDVVCIKFAVSPVDMGTAVLVWVDGGAAPAEAPSFPSPGVVIDGVPLSASMTSHGGSKAEAAALPFAAGGWTLMEQFASYVVQGASMDISVMREAPGSASAFGGGGEDRPPSSSSCAPSSSGTTASNPDTTLMVMIAPVTANVSTLDAVRLQCFVDDVKEISRVESYDLPNRRQVRKARASVAAKQNVTARRVPLADSVATTTEGAWSSGNGPQAAGEFPSGQSTLPMKLHVIFVAPACFVRFVDATRTPIAFVTLRDVTFKVGGDVSLTSSSSVNTHVSPITAATDAPPSPPPQLTVWIRQLYQAQVTIAVETFNAMRSRWREVLRPALIGISTDHALVAQAHSSSLVPVTSTPAIARGSALTPAKTDVNVKVETFNWVLDSESLTSLDRFKAMLNRIGQATKQRRADLSSALSSSSWMWQDVRILTVLRANVIMRHSVTAATAGFPLQRMSSAVMAANVAAAPPVTESSSTDASAHSAMVVVLDGIASVAGDDDDSNGVEAQDEAIAAAAALANVVSDAAVTTVAVANDSATCVRLWPIHEEKDTQGADSFSSAPGSASSSPLKSSLIAVAGETTTYRERCSCTLLQRSAPGAPAEVCVQFWIGGDDAGTGAVPIRGRLPLMVVAAAVGGGSGAGSTTSAEIGGLRDATSGLSWAVAGVVSESPTLSGSASRPPTALTVFYRGPMVAVDVDGRPVYVGLEITVALAMKRVDSDSQRMADGDASDGAGSNPSSSVLLRSSFDNGSVAASLSSSMPLTQAEAAFPLRITTRAVN